MIHTTLTVGDIQHQLGKSIENLNSLPPIHKRG